MTASFEFELLGSNGLISPRAFRGVLGNKAGYTATPVACGWAGAIFEVILSFGQEQ